MHFLLLLALFSITLGEDEMPRTWIVNLDLPPAQRWPLKDMIPYYNESIFEAIALIGEFIPSFLEPEVEELAVLALPYMGEYAEEIRSGAALLKIPLGIATLLNIIYEVEAGCTSIVAQDKNGNIYHGRNLDFNLAKVLRKLTIRVEFQKNGKTLYWGTTYAGYVGLLTGMRPGKFSISLNERDSGYLLENLLEALFVPGTYVASLLIRDTLQNVQTYKEAVDILANTSMVAPSYITVSGNNSGEGVVITRDREKAADVWELDLSSGRWFVVETNDDHWLPPEDKRRDAAINGMKSIGQSKIDLDGIYSVLSIHPVRNSETTYTTVMSAQSGNFTVWIREKT